MTKRRSTIGAKLGRKSATGSSPYAKRKKEPHKYPFATGVNYRNMVERNGVVGDHAQRTK